MKKGRRVFSSYWKKQAPLIRRPLKLLRRREEKHPLANIRFAFSAALQRRILWCKTACLSV